MQSPVAPASSTAAQRNTPFSSHSRGVPLFDSVRCCDFPTHLGHFGGELRDISSSFLVLLAIQPWLTLIAMIVTISSVACAPLDWALLSLPRPMAPHTRTSCSLGWLFAPSLPATETASSDELKLRPAVRLAWLVCGRSSRGEGHGWWGGGGLPGFKGRHNVRV